MNLLELDWWMYLFIVLTFFVVCLGLNYVVKKINETKIDERFIRMLHKASTTQSTQVTGPLIVMETTRAAQSNIKTPQPSPKGISLVFNQEENKRRKDLEDTMNIIKNSMFQKKFDALSLNTNASLEHIDTIPLVRSTRTVNDAIPLKISETALTAAAAASAEKGTHDTKSNQNVNSRVLVKRNEYALGISKEPSISNESDCYMTDLVSIEKNEYGHVAAKPTTSVIQSDANICDLFYMGDDSRIADTGTSVPFASNGNPVRNENVSVRVQQECEHNEVETTLPRTRHSFNANQSTSLTKESDHKIFRKSFPNIFKKHSNNKKVEDSGLIKIVHNIVSKISTLSKHSNVDTRNNTLEIKAKEINVDRETSTNAQVEIQPEQRNVPKRLSSAARADRCLTEVISMKQNESAHFVTKATSNVQSDHFKTASKIKSIRKCDSVKTYPPKYKNIATGVETAIAKETSATQKDLSLTVVASMKLKDLKDKPNMELLNTCENAQIGQNTHRLQSDPRLNEDTRMKIVEENQLEHIVIEEISDTKNGPNINVPERNKKSDPKKSSIELRSTAQTNLITPETTKNNDIKHKPVREASSPEIEGGSKAQAEPAKQSGLDGNTQQRLLTIEHKTDNNTIFYIPSKTTADNPNLIKSCFESKLETIMTRQPAVQNISSQSDRYETEEVVNKESFKTQSGRKINEPKVFICNDSKRSLSKNSFQNQRCVDETIDPSHTPNMNESNTHKIEHNTTEKFIKDELRHEANTNFNSSSDTNVTKSENIKVTESVHVAQTSSVLVIDDNEEQGPIVSSENIYSHSHSDRNVIQFRLDNMNKLLYMPHSRKDDDLSGNYLAKADNVCDLERNGSKYFRSHTDYKRIHDYKHALPTKSPFCHQSETVSSKIELPCAISDSDISEYISNDTDQTGQTTSTSFDASTSIIDDRSETVSDKIIKAKELPEHSNATKTEGGPSQATTVTGNEITIKDRIKALLLPPFINEDVMILKPNPKKK